MPPSVLRGYIEGKDPATQRTVIEEVIEAITKPVSEDEFTGDFAPVSRTGVRQTLLEPDTEDNLQRLFYERGWTDGLPIILPTEERVAEMLTGTNRAPDEVVSEIFLHDTQEYLTFHGRDGGHHRRDGGGEARAPARSSRCCFHRTSVDSRFDDAVCLHASRERADPQRDRNEFRDWSF